MGGMWDICCADQHDNHEVASLPSPPQELFAELIKGSLATFLDAFTYPDRTVFPTASTNLQAGRWAVHRPGCTF